MSSVAKQKCSKICVSDCIMISEDLIINNGPVNRNIISVNTTVIRMPNKGISFDPCYIFYALTLLCFIYILTQVCFIVYYKSKKQAYV